MHPHQQTPAEGQPAAGVDAASDAAPGPAEEGKAELQLPPQQRFRHAVATPLAKTVGEKKDPLPPLLPLLLLEPQQPLPPPLPGEA